MMSTFTNWLLMPNLIHILFGLFLNDSLLTSFVSIYARVCEFVKAKVEIMKILLINFWRNNNMCLYGQCVRMVKSGGSAQTYIVLELHLIHLLNIWSWCCLQFKKSYEAPLIHIYVLTSFKLIHLKWKYTSTFTYI